MASKLQRREFLQVGMAAGALAIVGPRLFAAVAPSRKSPIISPGCRRSKVRVARIYMVGTNRMWPTPKLDEKAEMQSYENHLAQMGKELADVEFVCSELVTSPDGVKALKDKLAGVDGILAIHINMGATAVLMEILSAGKPTVLFAAPYSGHEWTAFGGIKKGKQGALLECMLTSDRNLLAAAIRPFRAIHHMREAKILNITARPAAESYVKAVKDKFGTEIMTIGRQRVLDAYESIPDAEAKAETKRWMSGATEIVEPNEDEIFRSCKLALAFEKIVNEEEATVLTTDCYGSMYRQLPAFPCIGHTLLDDMGLGGVCESDLSCALTHVLLQSLSGKPAFVSDPTVDESKKSIILAHCRCATKMDGPDGEAAPYKLRTIMERQEGCVAQVRMRVGQKVTQAILAGTDRLLYFTGEIIEAPDLDRGCRTKINVRVDGDIVRLWENWSHGLHRQTVYGDLVQDLARFCRFKNVTMTNEAV